MFFMLRHHSGSKPRKAALRSAARKWPLLTLALLGTAACAGLPFAAQAQKPAPSKPRAASVVKPDAIAINPIIPGGPGATVPFNVSTYHYDNSRSGVNNLETLLTPANVSQTTFGKLFAQQLDGPTYGQPLYYANLTLTNSYTGQVSTHNAVFVATNNNTVYAFDADNNTGTNTTPLWSLNFNSPVNGITPTSGDDITNIFGFPQAEITPLVGIVGTPVMDSVNKVLYVVVRTTESNGYAHRLHAIDITTGQEKSYSPQLIGQQEDVFGDVSPVLVPGTGDDPFGVIGSTNYIFFDTATQNQRAALTLVNGTVYVAYGAFDNSPPFHGWMFSFDSQTLTPQGVFCTTPNESNSFQPGDAITTGSINMSGAGPAADASTLANPGLYFTTGLGNFDSTNGSYGESVLKLSSAAVAGLPTPYQRVPTLLSAIPFGNRTTSSSFTPFNYAFLRDNSIDLGVGGVALIPNLLPGHPKTLVTAGQEGRIYLLDGDNLGGYNSSGTGEGSEVAGTGVDDSGAIATFQLLLGPTYGVPAVYTSANASGTPTTTVYYHAAGQPLQPFTINPAAATPDQLLTANPLGTTSFDFPGAMPIVSANAGKNGLLWELESHQTPPPDGGGGIVNVPPTTVLHAYNATTIPAAGTTPAVPALKELFNSQGLNGVAGGANLIGDFIPFSFPQPLVANGKVYVTAGTATQSNASSGGLPNTPTTGTLVVFGIPTANSLPTRGYHYLLSGPFSTNFTNGGAIAANRTNYYSITAVDANYQPARINNSDVTLTLTNQITGRRLSLGTVHFSNQSYQVFSRAITQEPPTVFLGPNILGNIYSVQGHDASGNTINATSLEVSSTSQGGFGSVFDHFNVRLAPSARSGQTTTITLTPVNANNITIANYSSAVLVYDTLPNSVQDFNPGGSGYAYENINNIQTFPNSANSGSYSITFSKSGTHVVVIYDLISGVTTTATVNVL